MTAVYIYGITRNLGPTEFGCMGLPSGREKVEFVAHGGIGAVVSSYSGARPRELPRHELLSQLTLHQRVLEKVLEENSVLPVKFGTVLEDRTELRKALSCGAVQLERAVNRFDGTLQYEVAATWELASVFAEISREDEILALQEAARGKSDGEALGLVRAVGVLVKQSLDRRREAIREELVSLLASQAQDHAPNVLMGDDMVINQAFLVFRSASEGFLERLDVADARFQGRLNIRCIGPLPPYSFGSVEVLCPEREEIEAAAGLLGLGSEFSGSMVRKAFRERAPRIHPDVNPSPDAAGGFARLRTAEALLMACCQDGDRDRDGDREDQAPSGGQGIFSSERTDGNYLVSVHSAR